MHPDSVPLARAILQYLATLTGQPIPRKPCAPSARTLRNSPSFWAVSRRWMNSRLMAPCAIRSDRERRLLEPLAPAPKPGGRPVAYSRREVVNAISGVLRPGFVWRMLPPGLPLGRPPSTTSAPGGALARRNVRRRPQVTCRDRADRHSGHADHMNRSVNARHVPRRRAVPGCCWRRGGGMALTRTPVSPVGWHHAWSAGHALGRHSDCGATVALPGGCVP